MLNFCRRSVLQTLLIMLFLFTLTAVTHAQCSTEEMTAVFVVSGIYPGTDLQLDMMTVNPVGEATYPSHEEIEAALYETAPYPEPYTMYVDYSYLSSVEPFDIYWGGGDLYGIGIVDGRDGALRFVGQVYWMGSGIMIEPAESSHPWEFQEGALAGEPTQIRHVELGFWGDPTSETDASLAFLRQTDVLHSFSACGPYSVVSYIYTPTVGMTNPYVAKCIIIVSGHCGAPWSTTVVPNESTSWGSVKALFR